jgi:hypothetical protein
MERLRQNFCVSYGRTALPVAQRANASTMQACTILMAGWRRKSRCTTSHGVRGGRGAGVSISTSAGICRAIGTASIAAPVPASAADARPDFVHVYAARALFLAVIAVLLIAGRQFRALMIFVGAAVVMPVADAVQVSLNGAAPAIIARHCAIAAYLALTAYMLHRRRHNLG